MHVALDFQLRIGLKSGDYLILEGFKGSDYDSITEYFNTHAFGVTIERKEMGVTGWNYGTYEFDGNAMSFLIDSKIAFEIPLNAVSNASFQKNEATIEFHEVSVPVCRCVYR